MPTNLNNIPNLLTNNKDKGTIKHQQGFSLVEVMISLLLLSIGMVSLTNLQTRSVSIAMEAYTETQSALHLQELVELLRANKVAAAGGAYDISLSKFSDLSAVGENPSVADTDQYNWFNNLNNTLPGAKASIDCDNTSLCTLELRQSISGTETIQSLAVIL